MKRLAFLCSLVLVIFGGCDWWFCLILVVPLWFLVGGLMLWGSKFECV